MATQNEVKIGINVSDNGTAKKTVKNFEEITTAANTAKKAAAGINTPVGGTNGSRAVYAKAAPTGSQGLMKEQEGTAYGQARGAVGTGAAGRDFANQAQGLGGFVRLYATLAANAFAAGAAFRALSAAMDTANMVKGLDQLGAASGTALGSLSKQLANTTGGAISLREAMEATAKASSSGMSSENILRMGKAAKQASQALGVDMSDAVSRISRGITKLEPELLDELGIFVRVDDVVKKYAESTGKAASAITDFEKRQAFANAVLDQAEKKFGAIQLDTNPYTRLAATIADLSQSTLEFVNKGLTPLVSLLSNSPTALAVVLGGIAATLVKQAIPAISDFKAGLASAAEESKAVSQKKLQDVKSSLGAEMAMRLQHLDNLAEAEFTKFEAASDKLLKQKADSAKKLKKYDQEALRISQLDPIDITPENIKYLETLGDKKIAGNVTAISSEYKQLAETIKSYKQVEDQYNKAQKERNIILTEQHPLWTTIGQNEKVYHDEVTAARQRSASSQIAYTSSTRGFMAGMREARKEFSASKEGIVTTMELLDESGKKTGTTLTTTTAGMGLFTRSLNLAKNAAVGMTAALGTAINAFAPWLQVIGLVVAAGGALISWMSKTQEESAATTTALTGIKDATKNLSDTLDFINKKPILEQFDPKSVAAKATAISGLTDQIRKGFESAYKELDKMGASDQFVNWVSKLWSGDVESELSDRVSKGLANVFKSIDQSSTAGKAATKAVQDILKIDDLSSADAVSKALDSMSSAERRRAIEQISASVKVLGTDLQVSAARGTELVQAFDKSREALTKFKTSFIQKDQVTEYGQSLVDSYFKLGIALEDPQQKLQAIKTLAEGIKSVGGPTDIVIGLQALSAEVDNLNQVTKAIADIDSELAKLNSTKKAAQEVALTSRNEFDIYDANYTLQKVNAQIAALKATRDIKVGIQLDMRAQVEGANELVAKAQLSVFKTGADLVSSKLSSEFAKAGATVTNAIASVLSGTEAGIKMRAQSEKLMLNVQAEQIKVQRQQILATEANTVALEQERLDRDKANADVQDLRLGTLAKRQADLDARDAMIKEARSGKAPAKGMYASMVAKVGTSAGAGITNESLSLAQSLESSAAQLANINAQLKAVDISTADQQIQLQYKKRAENLQVTLNALKVDQDRIAASKELNSETNQAAILDRQALDSRVAEFNYQKNILAFEVEITRQKQAQKSVAKNSEAFKDIDKEIQRVNDLKQANEEAYAGNTITQGLKNRIELINASSKSAAQTANDQFIADSRALDTKSQQLDTFEKILEAQNSAGRLSTEFYIKEKDALEQKKAQLAFDKESLNARNTQKTALDEISRKESQLTAEREARIALFDQEAQGFDSAVQYTEAELTRQRELKDERTRVNDTYADTTTKAQGTLDILLKILGVTRESNLEQARYNDLLNAAGSIADSLKAVFDGAAESSQKVAAAMGNVVTSLANFAVNAEKGKKSLADLSARQEDFIAGKEGSKDVSSEIAKQDKQNRIDEIKGYAQIAGAAKGMFKEKTFAYKAFATVEKVLHVASMAMKIQEMFADKTSLASKLATNAAAMASDVAAAGVSAVKAVINAMSNLPTPFNYIAGAATAAVVYKLLNSIGGNAGPGVSGGAVENDGTGTVLGDKTAKSTAIKQSIEILQDSDPVLMRNSTNMLKHLRSIDNNIAQFGNSLTRSLAGQDIAGKMEVQTGARTTAFDAANIGSVVGTAVGFMFGGPVLATILGGVGSIAGVILNKIPLLGQLVAGAGKLLGIGTSSSVQGQGIQLGGQTLGEVTQTGLDASFYADIETKKKFLFVTYDKSVDRQLLAFSEQDRDLQLALNRIFEGAYGVALAASETFGISQADMMSRLSNYTLEKQSIALSGTLEEQQAQLTAGIGKITDKIFLSVLSGFEDFQKGGETYANTVSRIVYGTEEASVVLETLGINAIKFTDIVNKQGDIGAEIVRQSIVVQETANRFIREVIDSMSGSAQDIAELYNALDTMRDKVVDFGGSAEFVSLAAARAAGGADKLGDAIANFYDKFTTEAQKTADNNKKVGDLFSSLNLAIPKTREEVLTLVNALTSTDPAAAAKIMAATDKLDTYYKVIDTGTASLDSLISKFNQILQLTGSSAEILAATRSQIIGETPEDQKALQNYIFALEDVKTAEANLTKARQAEVTKLREQKSTTESTINSLKNYINSLKKFKDSLLLGAASPLTPAEKYAESKRQFDAILATAMGTAITPAEKAAKDVALSQLEGASTAFLDASRIYNASSAQYTTDFNLVQRALTDSGDSLALQLSVEQKTFNELEAQTSLLDAQIAALGTVNNSVLSVADAIAALDSATGAAAAAKEAVGPGGTFQLYSPGGGKILGNTVYGLNGLKGTLADAKTGTMNYAAQIEAGTTPASELRRIYVEDWGLDSKAMAYITGFTQQEILDWFKAMDPSLPAFAVGTNFVPEDMVAQIHRGERIIPAADNEELMTNIGNRNRTNEVLVAEIKKLNQEMKVLQKAVADGAVINAQATERNTVEISRTVKDTGSTASHTEAIRRRTQIV